MIAGYSNMPYENRLQYTGLTTLGQKKSGDLIEVFKFFKGFNTVDYRKYFKLVGNTRTRGYNYKIEKTRSRLDIRKNFFSQRIVNGWNSLPGDVVGAESINSFKNRYDKFAFGQRCKEKRFQTSLQAS